MAETGLSGHRRKRRRRRIRGLVGFFLLLLATYLLVTTFLIELYRVSDDAMSPAVEAGELLLASPLATRISEPGRGDLIVVENPAYTELNWRSHAGRRLLHMVTGGRRSALGNDRSGGSSLLLRRVIALPEERILMNNYEFLLRREGRWVSELDLIETTYSPGLPADRSGPLLWPAVNTPGSPDAPARTVPQDHYFLSADQRGGPLDSRSWGPLPAERVHATVLFRLLPLERFGVLPGAP